MDGDLHLDELRRATGEHSRQLDFLEVADVPREVIELSRLCSAAAREALRQRRVLDALVRGTPGHSGDLSAIELDALGWFAASSGTSTPAIVRGAVARACAEIVRRRIAEAAK